MNCRRVSVAMGRFLHAGAPRSSASPSRSRALGALLALLLVGCGKDDVVAPDSTSGAWSRTALRTTNVYSFAVLGTFTLAGTDSGVFRSSDHGVTWARSSTGLASDAHVLELLVRESEVFAGTWTGVFHSTDDGATWIQAEGLRDTTVDALVASGTFLFAGLNIASLNGGVFRSSNDGQTWEPASNGLPDHSVQALTVSGSNLVAGAHGPFLNGGAFYSNDDGANWTTTQLSGTATVSFATSGTSLFAGTISGVFKSNDHGASWSAASSGLTNTAIYSLAASGANLFAGTDDGVFRSKDGGSSWVAFNAGLARTSIPALIVSGDQVLAGTYGQGVWRRPVP